MVKSASRRILCCFLMFFLTQGIIACKIGGSTSSGGQGGNQTSNTNPGNTDSAGNLASKLTIISAQQVVTTYTITTVGQSPLRVQNP